MTTITCRVTGGRWYLDIEGHAGYGPAGRDIVCAAVSALTYTLAQCLANEKQRGTLREQSARFTDGGVYLMWYPSEGGEKRMRAVWETVNTGFSMLAAKYPGHVKQRIEPRMGGPPEPGGIV